MIHLGRIIDFICDRELHRYRLNAEYGGLSGEAIGLSVTYYARSEYEAAVRMSECLPKHFLPRHYGNPSIRVTRERGAEWWLPLLAFLFVTLLYACACLQIEGYSKLVLFMLPVLFTVGVALIECIRRGLPNHLCSIQYPGTNRRRYVRGHKVRKVYRKLR